MIFRGIDHLDKEELNDFFLVIIYSDLFQSGNIASGRYTYKSDQPLIPSMTKSWDSIMPIKGIIEESHMLRLDWQHPLKGSYTAEKFLLKCLQSQN